MSRIQHLGPGSSLPLWLELLDRSAFGETWGALDEQEELWCLPGTAFARWRVHRLLEEAELVRIAVLPECRGQGLGGQILAHAMGALTLMGIATLHLEVRASNTPAQALYRRHGWREVGLRPRYYKDGEDALLYTFTAAVS